MSSELALWAAQDALLSALSAQEVFDVGGPTEVALDLGFPRQIAPEHVWIDGEAEGRLEAELTERRPSHETFLVKLFVFAQGVDYVDVRDRVRVLAGACDDALTSDVFAGAVPAWQITRYRLDAGTDGANRQLCLELTVECSCW